MSESEEERKVVVEGPTSTQREEVIRRDVPEREVIRRDTTVPERREERIVRTRTNSGAIAALIVGAFVLIFGIYIVFSQIRFFGPPFSYIAILIVGLILIGVGAKLMSNRVSMV